MKLYNAKKSFLQFGHSQIIILSKIIPFFKYFQIYIFYSLRIIEKTIFL